MCDYFLDKGAEEITIGEGSAFFSKPHHWDHLIKACGYEFLAKKSRVNLINLEEKSVEREKHKWKYGELMLPKFLKTHEYINIPVMKTHIQTQVSLGCKNQKGLLLLNDKKKFHQKELNPYIFQLNKVIIPDLTIMDAIYCVEGNGPDKNPMSFTKELNLLLASLNTAALDNACCEIMGFNIEEVPSIPKVDFNCVGLSTMNVKRAFKKPTLITYVHGNIGEYMPQTCCTCCQISNSQMMRKIEFSEELLSKLNNLKSRFKFIFTLFGKDHDITKIPYQEKVKILCFGNCSKKFAEKHKFPWIGGCPPEYHEMVNFLLKELNIEEQ